MGDYRHILAAVDFGSDSGQVLGRATALARALGARLSLVHVVEFLQFDLASELVLPQDVQLEAQMVEAAKRRLAAMAADIDVGGPVNQWVELGATKQEIVRIAATQGVDLIVIGSHGRHGIGRLLGSTANAVLHGAGCDVLAVRIRAPG